MDKATHTLLVSESFRQTDEKHRYEIPFRKWLVREIEAGNLTTSQAVERFNFSPSSGAKLIRDWRNKYAAERLVSLPEMTAEDKQKLSALQQQIKVLEKQVEDVKMKNIAINMLIDVAEEKLKISIRKKHGAKQ